MNHQQVVTSIRPKPSPYKEKLRRRNITAGAAAQFIGLSYPYVLNMLNGAHPMAIAARTARYAAGGNGRGMRSESQHATKNPVFSFFTTIMGG